jgi:hypothetical protein
MAAAHSEIVDQLLDEAIFRAVRGEPSLWPVDPDHRVDGTYKERFERGDKQILLWAIEDHARNNELIPEWAAEALKNTLLRFAKGKCSWEDAFGRPIARGMHRQRIENLSLMYEAWWRVRQKVNERKANKKVKERRAKKENIDYDLLYEGVSRELRKAGRKIGIGKVKEFHGLVQKDSKKHPQYYVRISI